MTGIELYARAVIANAEIAGMQAENQIRQSEGYANAYREDSFQGIAEDLRIAIAAYQDQQKEIEIIRNKSSKDY